MLKAPDEFKVLAIISTYNEADVIEYSISQLIDDGVEVYLIDNCSKDDTYAIAESFLGKGLVGLEHFPKPGRTVWNLTEVLKRKEQIFRNARHHNWFMHCDADEYRQSPWPGVGIKDALYYVDQCGYNCVDYTVMNFRAIDNLFEKGDFIKHFEYFEFGLHSAYFVQRKTWKNLGIAFDIASFHGHDVKFAGKRIFPYKFLNRHYQFRSEEQVIRKLFYDRQPVRTKAKSHGDFLAVKKKWDERNCDGLLRCDEQFYDKYLVERLSGIGIPDPIS